MGRNRFFQAVALAFVAVFGTALGVGESAPDFSLQGSDGKTYQLSELLQEGAVVLAWYPKAFTKGCTIECKSPDRERRPHSRVQSDLLHGQRRSY